TRPARSRRGSSPRRAPTSASASPSTWTAAGCAGACPPWRRSRASACVSCARASCPRPSCARSSRRADGRRPSARRPPLRSRELLAGAQLGAPLVDVNGWHQLWRVTDAAAIARVEAALADQTIIIADGHHRYETALAYRDEQRGNDAAAYILAYLANMEEEGVVILPTHRLVRRPLGALEARLGESFVLEPLDPRRR